MGLDLSTSPMGHEWSESATELVESHAKGELTQSMVDTWLASVDENFRDYALHDLESAIGETREDLPK